MVTDRERLIQLMAERALRSFQEGSIPLSSGKSSKYYVDAKMVCQDPEVAPLIVDAFKELIGDIEVDAVGGPTIGAVPIIGALSGKGYFRTFFIRKQAKKHGLSKWIEGPLTRADKKVVIIDDVATTGQSIKTAITSLKKDFPNIEISKIIVLVDREDGASELLRDYGCNFVSILTLRELIAQTGEKWCAQAA